MEHMGKGLVPPNFHGISGEIWWDFMVGFHRDLIGFNVGFLVGFCCVIQGDNGTNGRLRWVINEIQYIFSRMKHGNGDGLFFALNIIKWRFNQLGKSATNGELPASHV